MKYTIFTILLIITTQTSYAQNLSFDEIDSLMLLSHKQGNYPKAITYLEQGRTKAIAEFGAPEIKYADYTAWLGHLNRQLEQYEAAEVFLLRALQLHKEINGKRHQNYVNDLGNLAMLYQELGKYEEAKPMLLEVSQIYKEELGDDNPYYAATLDNIGGLYQEMENYKAAEPLFLRAKEIRAKALGLKHPLYALSQNNLGTLYYNKGNYEQAIPFFKEAWLLEKEIHGEEHPKYARALNNLSNGYKKIGDYKKAEELLFEARDIYKKTLGTSHSMYATALNNIASLYATMENKHLADSFYREAITAMCKNCNSSIEEDVSQLSQNDFFSNTTVMLSLKGIQTVQNRYYESSGDIMDLKKGYTALQVSLELNEKMRNSFVSEKDKLRSLKKTSTLASDAIATAVALSKDDQQYTKEAFNYAEQNKSVLLADATKGERAKVLGQLPDSVASIENDLQTEKSLLQKEEQEAQSDSVRALVRAKQIKLNQEINDFLKRIKKNFPKYHALKYESITAKVEEVQALLDSETMFLEYFVADTTTYLFAITQKTIEIIPIRIKKGKLNDEIRVLRKALSDYKFITNEKKKAYGLFTRQASMFYDLLVKAALKDQNVKNLIIVTDGNLGHLPFEVFLTENIAQSESDYQELDYLIKEYAISYNYSATLWQESQAAPLKKNNNKLFACAAAYPPMVHANAQNVTDSLNLYSHRPYYLAKWRNHLKPLPAAQSEIATLSKLFQGEFLYGDSTNEAYFKKNAAQFGTIHLAMHGLLHSRTPILSALAFSENNDSIEDNFLQAYEIGDLELNADLVVLSACETGFGEFEQGEGIISLARSFMYAGTPSLVVSLWQVNDYSTAVIMKHFYQNLAEGMTKDKALREAKLVYINKATGITAHPAFWSPFIQLGNNQPIKIKTKSQFSILTYTVGAGLCLVMLFLWKRKRSSQLEV